MSDHFPTIWGVVQDLLLSVDWKYGRGFESLTTHQREVNYLRLHLWLPN